MVNFATLVTMADGGAMRAFGDRRRNEAFVALPQMTRH